MVGTTAENDSEIGARMGVCFTFTGTERMLLIAGSIVSPRNYVFLLGFGGLIGTAQVLYFSASNKDVDVCSRNSDRRRAAFIYIYLVATHSLCRHMCVLRSFMLFDQQDITWIAQENSMALIPSQCERSRAALLEHPKIMTWRCIY